MASSVQNEELLISLVQGIRQRDRQAEEKFVLQFGEGVFLMLLKRTGDPDIARDLAQETLMTALLSLRNGKLREEARLAGFVHGIAKNIFLRFLRAKGQRPYHTPYRPSLMLHDPGQDPAAAERTALLRQALDRLDPGARTILELTLVDGLKPGEIAQRLDMKPELVRKRKSRAVQKITAFLQERMSQSGLQNDNKTEE